MDKEGKPVPVPRRLNNASPNFGIGIGTKDENNSMQRNGNVESFGGNANNNVNANSKPGQSSGGGGGNGPLPAKPVPLPRKLIQRLSSGKKSPVGPTKLEEAAAAMGVNLNEEVTDEVRRGTINIFKRGRSIDPFDTEFESSLRDAKLLTSVSFPSPLQDVSPETRSRFSTVSSSSASVVDEGDHYMEPRSSVGPDLINQNRAHSFSTEFKVPFNSGPNSSKVNSGFSQDDEGRKSYTPTRSPLTIQSNARDKEHESSETDGSESIYEPISSYSSDSGSALSSEYPTSTKGANGPSTGSASTSRPESKFSSFDACDFIGDPPLKTGRSSFKKLDFQSRVVGGGEGRYERLRDESLSSSLPAIDAEVNEDKSKIAKNTNANANAAISSAEASPPVNHFRRNLSGRSSDSTASSLSYTSTSGGEKMKINLHGRGHEYDDVAMEDGNVVFLDNQLNALPIVENNNNSNSSIASIVMEFDPLFDSESKANGKVESGPETPKHRYEYIDEETSEDHTRSSTVDPFPTDFSNPEYFPTQVKRDESLSTVAEEKARSNSMGGNGSVSGQGSAESISSSEFEMEYEAVAPIPPARPPKPKDKNSDIVPRAKPKAKPLEILDDSQTDGKSAAAPTQSNFFRRLSNKMKLISIKEEGGGGTSDGAGSGNKSGEVQPLQIPICVKCLEEHPVGVRCKFEPFARPSIVFSSNLFRQATSGFKQKDFSKKWVVLAKGKLTFMNEKSVVLDEICLTKAAVIAKKNEPPVVQNLQELKCFQLSFVSGKPTHMTLAALSEGERCSWMQKYMEVFAPAFPLSIISSYDRGGWCFMKESLTANWYPSWMILKDRTLYYCFNNSGDVNELDLRKSRSITLNFKEGDHRCPFVENTDVLTIDTCKFILYVQTENPKITASWCQAIETAAKKNGTEFHQMQLTMDNVPVIVDKCIDFLYAHGTLAEGIYRQSGSNSRITQLLAEFQKDAWAVQISPKDFSAHDVAGTLKRFFRTLPEPLLTASLYQKWIDASGIKETNQKMEEYLSLMSQLPEISYNIMKKLICHLYAVHELHEKNLMPLINLAPIWGPTLMNVDGQSTNISETATTQSYRVACAECEVVKDLIENYYTLFRVDSQEREKEKKMQDALENFHLGSTKRKCSGDMKMWIYIWEKDETSAVNITLTPLSTSNTIVQQLCRIAKITNTENLALHEVICLRSLERPIHPSEKVIETVLRWSIWDIDERKDNYLILKQNTLYPLLIPYARDPTAVYGELKFADSKSKSYRKYNFTFSGAMLKYSKDAKATTELGKWEIENLVWYMGTEHKRIPPTRWTFTFVKRNYPFKRSRDEPFFGNVVSCSSEEELYKWIGAMIVGEHPEGLYPSVIV